MTLSSTSMQTSSSTVSTMPSSPCTRVSSTSGKTSTVKSTQELWKGKWPFLSALMSAVELYYILLCTNQCKPVVLESTAENSLGRIIRAE